MANETTIFSQDKLLELYEKLPQQLKDAIFGVDVADKIMKTGQKFGLNVEQTGGLAEATGLVMLGALHPRSYIQKLEETLKIERTKAVDVAKEVNHEIFFPVREQLKKLHGMEDTEEVTGERTTERGDLLKKLAELKNKALGTRQSALGTTEVPSVEQKQAQPPPPIIPLMQKIPSPPARGAEEQALGTRQSALGEKREAGPALPAEKQKQPAPKLEALQNEIQGLLKKAPVPDVPVAPRPIPGWAKQKEQALGTRDLAIGMKQEQKEQLPVVRQTQQPVQKIPMQEIRPRPTEETRDKRQETRPGPGGDRYREAID